MKSVKDKVWDNIRPDMGIYNTPAYVVHDYCVLHIFSKIENQNVWPNIIRNIHFQTDT